jgi:hypothetical protein
VLHILNLLPTPQSDCSMAPDETAAAQDTRSAWGMRVTVTCSSGDRDALQDAVGGWIQRRREEALAAAAERGNGRRAMLQLAMGGYAEAGRQP